MKNLKHLEGTPTMRRAKMLINSQEKLLNAIINSPNLSANRMAKLTRWFTELTKQIERRTFTDVQVEQLLKDVQVYSRNYRRVGDKLKLSKRAVKYIYKQAKNVKAKNQNKKKPIDRSGNQTTIFEG